VSSCIKYKEYKSQERDALAARARFVTEVEEQQQTMDATLPSGYEQYEADDEDGLQHETVRTLMEPGDEASESSKENRRSNLRDEPTQMEQPRTQTEDDNEGNSDEESDDESTGWMIRAREILAQQNHARDARAERRTMQRDQELEELVRVIDSSLETLDQDDMEVEQATFTDQKEEGETSESSAAEDVEEWEIPPEDEITKMFMISLEKHLQIPFGWRSLTRGHRKRFRKAHVKIKKAIANIAIGEKELSWLADEIIETMGPMRWSPICEAFQTSLHKHLNKNDEAATLPVSCDESSEGETIKLDELLGENPGDDKEVATDETSLGHEEVATENQ
jgi:hypothetical protein